MGSDRFAPSVNVDTVDFLAAYGRAMMAWNTAEAVLRTFLEVLIEEDKGAGLATIQTLSADTSAEGLERAAGVLAKAVLRAERADDADYAVKLFGRLRGYRNHLAHGPNHLVVRDGEVVAPVLSWTAGRKGLRKNQDIVTRQDLDAFTAQVSAMSDYIMALPSWWYPVQIPGMTPMRPERPVMLPEPSPPRIAYASFPRPKRA